jgi:voltage-gated potassium channel Kch
MRRLRIDRIGWRPGAALLLFLSAFGAFGVGVDVSERDLASAGILARAYYALALFVVGGIDLGTPEGGPVIARGVLWITYFGAPLLFASAVFEAVIRLLAPELWQLQRMRGHFVVVGVDDLTMSYLRVLRRHHPRAPVVVVDEAIAPIREQELEQTFGVRVVHGDITHDFLLRALRLDRARRIALLSDDNFRAFEAASRILSMHPELGPRMVLHCNRIRFLRAMADTRVAQRCETFNVYHLAAAGFVRDTLVVHFEETTEKDVVVLAGFGRFGQSILEELRSAAPHEMDTVAIVDMDAERRVQVVDEQARIGAYGNRVVVEGDISHPDIWRRLGEQVNLQEGSPTVILGTGRPEENLRTAIWLRGLYPNARIFVRTNDVSAFARELGAEHDIESLSITQLVERHLPGPWVD